MLAPGGSRSTSFFGDYVCAVPRIASDVQQVLDQAIVHEQTQMAGSLRPAPPGGLYTRVLAKPANSEQMIRLAVPQGFAAGGFATIFRKMSEC